ncbi:phosphorothioated DNA-binding restriction endonuclease [Kitasatospora sp. NPDC058032]|uniref:phosphorothioated DNA-binding restriction endonuclease n=1 Tax=Kitasatospora sp. NPDC058032 TaxID=3346307 RepID=UPI0036DCB404
MKRGELLDVLCRLRQANTGGVRAPHKPLLLLWLLGRHARLGSSLVGYAEAEEPVSRLINDFGPAVGRVTAVQRAAMPFVRLERSLWSLRDATGRELDARDVRESGAALRGVGAVGRLRPEVERLLTEDPSAGPIAVRLLLDRHFTPTLEAAICEQADVELPDLGIADLGGGDLGGRDLGGRDLDGGDPDAGAAPDPVFRLIRRRVRAAGFAADVLRAFDHACAFCGYDGRLGRHPVGVEAAHIRWHSQGGPDVLANAFALCSLHHALFDFGVLGVTEDRTVRISPHFRTDSPAGEAVRALHDRPVPHPHGRPAAPRAHDFLRWHDRSVFKHDGYRLD